MGSGLFREKSLEKISSPERIDDYIKTSGSGVWVLLLAVGILLAGAFLWSVFGDIEITINAVAVCEDGAAKCYVSENDADKIPENASARINGEKYVLSQTSDLPVPAYETLSPYEMHIAGFNEDEWVCVMTFDSDLSNGVYKTEIAAQSVSPVSLLLN